MKCDDCGQPARKLKEVSLAGPVTTEFPAMRWTKDNIRICSGCFRLRPYRYAEPKKEGEKDGTTS